VSLCVSDKMTADRVPYSSAQTIAWNVENEIHLFDAMIGHKPVGVNKHFQMLMILERFCTRVQREVPSEVLWEKLEKLYDMTALDEMETLPFPNAQSEFNLPSEEFDSLIQAKLKECEVRRDEEALAARAAEEPARRSRASLDRGVSATREKRKSDGGDAVRRSSKRTRDSTSKSGSPASTPSPAPKRSRRI